MESVLSIRSEKRYDYWITLCACPFRQDENIVTLQHCNELEFNYIVHKPSLLEAICTHD